MGFHDATYRLLGAKPRISSAAPRRLEAAERRLGVELPPSVREWYERKSAVQILSEHSNCDRLVEIDEFELESIEGYPHPPLPIRYENQGVCTWAIELSGHEDPPVLVDTDDYGECWIQSASTFSEWVYCCVWDYEIVLNSSALVGAHNRKLSSTTLEALKAIFTPQPTTHGFPCDSQFRFRGEYGGLLIWGDEQKTDWYLGAPGKESLRATLAQVWQLDDVGQAFSECTEYGRDAMNDLRQWLKANENAGESRG